MTEYDAVVIGAGPGGESVIPTLAGAGLKVAVVERDLVGGTCAYWGCIPSKTLLRPGGIDIEARHGFGTGEAELNWPEIARYRNWMVRDWNDSQQVEDLRRKGIDFFRGEAVIDGPGRVKVGSTELATKRIVVATGSDPAILPIDGLDEIGYWTNREATSFQQVPRSILILGGGAIGCELGQAMRAFGTDVTIVEATDQLLGRESKRAAGFLEKSFEAQGIALRLGRKAVRFAADSGKKVATLDSGETLSAHEVLVATGRKPNVTGIGLENVGAKSTRKGIEVDHYCRAADNVWAVGDVTGVAGFTHVADYQGQIACADILGRPRPANYSDIPSVTFTDPEVASVGISQASAAPEGMDVVEAFAPLSAASRTYTYGERYEGGLNLVADRQAKVLVGAWAVGPLAGEWMQPASLAVRGKIPIDVLADTMLAFPTFTRLFREPIRELQSKVQ